MEAEVIDFWKIKKKIIYIYVHYYGGLGYQTSNATVWQPTIVGTIINIICVGNII